MRGASVVEPGGERVILATLVGAAAVVALAHELGGDAITGYVVLCVVFLLVVAVYEAYLYWRRPGSMTLWALSLGFAALFFSADGIVGLDLESIGDGRAGLATSALMVLAVGLIGSWAGFQLVSRSCPAGAPRARVFAHICATRLSVVLAAMTSVWGLRVYAASRGLVLSHAGDVMTDVGAGASMAIQLSLLGRPLVVFLGASLLADRQRGRRVLGLAIVVGEFAYAMLFARRLMLELVVAMAVCALWSGRRVRPRQAVTYICAVSLITVVAWPFMFHLRVVANQANLYGPDFSARAETLMWDVLPRAIATFDLGESFEAGSDYLENVRERARISDFLMDIEDAHQAGTQFMGGQALLAGAVATIPRAIWPGKERLMATETWQVEELIESHFGLPIVDVGSTVLTHGYADGGIPGAFAFMVLFGGLLGVAETTLGRSRCSLLGLWIYALGASMAIQVEADVTDLFAIGRVFAVLLLIDWLAGRWIERWVLKTRLRQRMANPAWAL